jgi:hypothetical protein
LNRSFGATSPSVMNAPEFVVAIDEKYNPLLRLPGMSKVSTRAVE